MSTNKLVFDNIKYGGLGTILCTISSMLSMDKSVVWKLDRSSNSDMALGDYITTCLNIHPDKFKFEYNTDTTHRVENNVTDINKFFSPYIPVEYIMHNEQRFDLTTDYSLRKPCVGLAMYHRKTAPGDFNYSPFSKKTGELKNEWPELKMWPMDVNLKIIELLTRAGYDVITFDNTTIRLNDKIHMLNSYCDFVIGYEGGLHHLAHILKIPSIVLPWRVYSWGKDQQVYVHSLHIDKKTWIFESIDEFLNYTPTDLIQLRDKLVNDNGNNIFLNNEIGISETYRSIKVNEKLINWPFFNNHGIEFISHIQNKKIGGIKEFYYF